MATFTKTQNWQSTMEYEELRVMVATCLFIKHHQAHHVENLARQCVADAEELIEELGYGQDNDPDSR